jgi:hypothetical protein
MPALGANPHPAAAASLARFVVLANYDDVRTAAIAGLKRHPLDHFVPLLLSGMQSPIEASMQCTLSAGGDLVTWYSMFQEGALSNVSASLALSPVYPVGDVVLPYGPAPVSVAPGTGTVQYDSPLTKQYFMRTNPGRIARANSQASADAAAANGAVASLSTPAATLAADAQAAQANAANAATAEANWQANAQNAQAQAVQNEAAMRDAVDRANSAIADRNAKIKDALCQTTGMDLGDRPTQWWTWWWQDYNEMYNVSGGTDQNAEDTPPKPESHYDTHVDYPGSAPQYLPSGPPAPITVGKGAVTVRSPFAHSCFAPGTKVWTLCGRQAIETIKVGDRVLAQNVESGELAYKPVLAVTIRPPGPLMKIATYKESITTTPSHPFWVSGQGWRMSKQLESGNLLHALSGGVAVSRIETLPADPASGESAYNLIVADYSSYFVGEQGILVHDNTPRAPTAAVLPGLTRQETGR